MDLLKIHSFLVAKECKIIYHCHMFIERLHGMVIKNLMVGSQDVDFTSFVVRPADWL